MSYFICWQELRKCLSSELEHECLNIRAVQFSHKWPISQASSRSLLSHVQPCRSAVAINRLLPHSTQNLNAILATLVVPVARENKSTAELEAGSYWLKPGKWHIQRDNTRDINTVNKYREYLNVVFTIPVHTHHPTRTLSCPMALTQKILLLVTAFSLRHLPTAFWRPSNSEHRVPEWSK